MNENRIGKLTIFIGVNWKGQHKRVAISNWHCTREEASTRVREFFEQNPCCTELDPEVIWKFEDRISW
jgi:hypothetical protein